MKDDEEKKSEINVVLLVNLFFSWKKSMCHLSKFFSDPFLGWNGFFSVESFHKNVDYSGVSHLSRTKN